jgi:hypothetical protein
MAYGVKLDPQPIGAGLSVRDLVDHHLYAYNCAKPASCSRAQSPSPT